MRAGLSGKKKLSRTEVAIGEMRAYILIRQQSSAGTERNPFSLAPQECGKPAADPFFPSYHMPAFLP
jgi:hypothetical protein